MARILSFVFVLSMVLNAALGQPTRGRQPSARSNQLADANNRFALNILTQLPKRENVFFSPYSVSTALGMVYLGARHNTAQEMERTLGYQQADLQSTDVPQAYKELWELLSPSSNDPYTLELANRVLKSTHVPIMNSYKSDLSRYFNTNLDEVDFAKEGEAIKENVNRWVNEKTKGIITSLLDQPLDPDTVMFLLNAIYFKGTWKTQFESKDTKPSAFYNSGEHSKHVPMMHLLSDANYTLSTELNSKVLELPYTGEDLSMVIVLPQERKGLEDLETRLTPEKLHKAINNLAQTSSVNIKLPRYKLETKYDLKGILQRVGMREVFSDKADLSRIAENGGLKISKIIHKAVVEVNEKGSEAAAVTGIGVVPYSALVKPPKQVLFHAEHPFLFAIREKSTGLILFLGRVNQL